MAFKYSTGFKNHVCVTGSVKDAFDGFVIKLYSAPTSVPSSADDALPGDAVLLNTYSKSGTGTGVTLSATATAGTATKESTETWSGTAVATGTAAFFRAELPADTNNASTTALRIQGLVAVAGADMNISSVAISSGTLYTIDFFSLTFYSG